MLKVVDIFGIVIVKVTVGIVELFNELIKRLSHRQ